MESLLDMAVTPQWRRLVERVNKKRFGSLIKRWRGWQGGGKQANLGFKTRMRNEQKNSNWVQIEWNKGNWGAEVLATLSRQTSHIVFACTQMFLQGCCSLKRNEGIAVHLAITRSQISPYLRQISAGASFKPHHSQESSDGFRVVVVGKSISV